MNEVFALLPLFAAAFFLIAVLYSSVGFGGGSSYLAILSIFVSDFSEIKTIALLCNLAVVMTSCYYFVREGFFDKKKFLPLALCSIPAAFLAATIHLTQKVFFISLGSVLALSGILLVVQILVPNKRKEHFTAQFTPVFCIGVGAGCGFLAGLIGIGGGILISPILNLLKLEHPKKIAALASFFILVNSVAGLFGQIVSKTFTIHHPSSTLLLILAVFLGGQFGTRISLKILQPHIVKGLTGILVGYVGLKLVLKYTVSIDI
jgi:uncharacterized membrane protein YfcA